MVQCQQCGAQLAGQVDGGLCPACLVQLARKAGTTSPLRRIAPLTIDQLQGRVPGLEFISLVGAGGMGAVYRAKQVDLDRDVAVKVLPAELATDPTFVERFRREARALARLDHPNIVHVYGSGVSGDLCYIVMEFVEGVTLREAIAERAIDPAAALRIVPQICEALEFAHRSGVVHRDIKPENILLGVGGKVKVADFGLAKLVTSEDPDMMLTATGATMGTLRYMAPEQFDGTDTDQRTDIYALGVVFYELLTGHVPMGHFPPPSETPGVDPRVDAVVMRTLQREPARRYQTASEVRTDLYRIAKGEQLEFAAASNTAQRQAGESYVAYRQRIAATGQHGFRNREWKSRSSLFGYPLVHVSFGMDPVTGKKRVAKGWIAIGDIAVGGIALGGLACGLIAFGGAAFGLTALGGLAIGLQMAMGGAAIGGFAVGGGSIGVVAMGGAAIGLVALGGGAFGYVAIGGGAGGAYTANWRGWSDPAFSSTWLGGIIDNPDTPWGMVGFSVFAFAGPILFVFAAIVIGWLTSVDRRAGTNPVPRDVKRLLWGHAIGLVVAMVSVLVAGSIQFSVYQTQLRKAEVQRLRAREAQAAAQAAAAEIKAQEEMLLQAK